MNPIENVSVLPMIEIDFFNDRDRMEDNKLQIIENRRYLSLPKSPYCFVEIDFKDDLISKIIQMVEKDHKEYEGNISLVGGLAIFSKDDYLFGVEPTTNIAFIAEWKKNVSAMLNGESCSFAPSNDAVYGVEVNDLNITIKSIVRSHYQRSDFFVFPKNKFLSEVKHAIEKFEKFIARLQEKGSEKGIKLQ
jgi:hypothetical protein